MPKTKKSKTHFEQVPLGTLKNLIAEEEIPDDEGDGADVTVEAPAKTDPYFRLWGQAR
jgi:hypothetical protein